MKTFGSFYKWPTLWCCTKNTGWLCETTHFVTHTYRQMVQQSLAAWLCQLFGSFLKRAYFCLVSASCCAYCLWWPPEALSTNLNAVMVMLKKEINIQRANSHCLMLYAMKSQQENAFKLKTKNVYIEIPSDICKLFLNKLFSLKCDKLFLLITIICFLFVCTVAIICYSGNYPPWKKFPI